MSFTVLRRFWAEKDKIQTDLFGSDGFTILTYGENTGEWGEANANLEEKKKELIKQIELKMGSA